MYVFESNKIQLFLFKCSTSVSQLLSYFLIHIRTLSEFSSIEKFAQNIVISLSNIVISKFSELSEIVPLLFHASSNIARDELYNQMHFSNLASVDILLYVIFFRFILTSSLSFVLIFSSILQALRRREVMMRIGKIYFFISIEVKKISPKGESFSQSSLND